MHKDLRQTNWSIALTELVSKRLRATQTPILDKEGNPILLLPQFQSSLSDENIIKTINILNNGMVISGSNLSEISESLTNS